MQEFNREDTIANLYALRAGLSMISEMSDKEKDMKLQIANAENRHSIKKEKLSDLPNQKQRAYEEYEIAIRQARERVEQAERELEVANHNREIVKDKKRSKWGAFSAAIATVWREDVIENWLVWLLGLIVVPVLGLIIEPIIFWCRVFSKMKKDIRDTNASYAEIRKRIEVEANLAQDDLEDWQDRLNRLLQEKEKVYCEIERRYTERKDRARESIKEEWATIKNTQKGLEKLKENFSVVYKSIKEQFSTVLDERDWANVDLIIFNYETGRAMDLRDALLQVDMERRNEKLMSALACATKEIAHTIQKGFGHLTEVMEEKFNTLTLSVLYSAKAIHNKLSDIEEQNAKKIKTIMDISSAQEALLNKINVSSERLVKDLDYMREVVEYNDNRNFS